MKNYELLSKYYDEIQNMDYLFFIELVNEFIVSENATVIDIGSGTGKFTKILLDNFYEPIGIDLSENNVLLSLQKYPYIKFINENYLTYNFFKKFDFAVAFMDVLNYFISDDDIEMFFKKTFDNLNDEGYFIFDINHENKLLLNNFSTKIKIDEMEINWQIKVENNFLNHELIFKNGFKEKHLQRIESYDFYQNIFSRYFEEVLKEEHEDRIFIVLKRRSS